MLPHGFQGTNGSTADPRISILIPSYNRADFLQAAVSSALAQNVPADEIIVVDDGSTDNTSEVMQPFIQQGVRFVPKEHSGAPATRNRAIDEASGDFLLWLDSDDVLLEHTVELYRKALKETPQVDVFYGSLLIVENNLEVTGKELMHPDWFGDQKMMVSHFLFKNVVPNPGTLVRKACYNEMGGYDLGYPRAHDYEFWVRIAPKAIFRRVNEPVVLWRWHDANMSSPTVDFDTRYDIQIVQTLLARYTIEDLFPDLGWAPDDRPLSLGVANLRIAQRMLQLGSKENAIVYLRRSLEAFPLGQSRDLLVELESGSFDWNKVGYDTEPDVTLDEQPLTILLTAHRNLPESKGGVEIYTDQLAKELVSRGHNVHLLVPALSPTHKVGEIGNEERDGYTLWRVVTRTELLVDEFQLEDLVQPIRDLIEKIKPDIAHCQHLIGLTLTVLHELKHANIPVVGTIHDAWFACHQFHFLEGGIEPCSGPETVDKCVHCLLKRNPDADAEAHLPELFYFFALRRQQMKRGWQAFDRLLVPTKTLKNKLLQAGFDHKAISVNPLGMAPLDHPKQTTGNGRLRIVLPGNVYPTKGQDIAIKALHSLPLDKSELHIHGEEVNPTYLAQLKALIPGGATVQFHGGYSPEDMPGILATADICLIPSRSENYPLVVRESLRAGVPVVASNVGGIPEIIQDGINGMLFKVGDDRSLADVLTLLIKRPELLDGLREGIEPVKTISDDADQLLAIYREMLPDHVLEELVG
ncbi:glycosyltransferase [bacterium]|nr:glycosyltransferase [bacterium]